jgi:hypothetical protein
MLDAEDPSQSEQPSTAVQHTSSDIQSSSPSPDGLRHSLPEKSPEPPATVIFKKDSEDESNEWRRMWIETIFSVATTGIVFVIGYRLGKRSDQEKTQLEVAIQILRDSRSIRQTWIAIIRTEREIAEIEAAAKDFGTDDDSRPRTDDEKFRLQERHASLRDRRADLMTSLSIGSTISRLAFGPRKSAQLEKALEALQSAALVDYSKIRGRIDREVLTKDFSGVLVTELRRIDLIISAIQDQVSGLMRPIMVSRHGMGTIGSSDDPEES